jgi:hypothetical protein
MILGGCRVTEVSSKKVAGNCHGRLRVKWFNRILYNLIHSILVNGRKKGQQNGRVNIKSGLVGPVGEMKPP